MKNVLVVLIRSRLKIVNLIKFDFKINKKIPRQVLKI
ncbi:unnamed protein product [Tenebrio molitor]|nr:unnamed protein product [Tenebrio molitor]